MIEVHTIEPRLHALEVPAFLGGGFRQRVVSAGSSVDLRSFKEACDAMRSDRGILGAESDASLAPILHDAVRGLGRRQLLDAGLWHWMCLEPLRDYVLDRWCGGGDAARTGSLTAANLNRFVGGPTLVGVGRNAAARLFWGAEAAYATSGSYADCSLVFGSADLYVGVFERKLGLHPEAAMAIIRRLVGRPEPYRREALKRLNFILSTTALEALAGPEVVAELDRLMA